MKTDAELSNQQFVTLVVYLLGGDSHYVDTEDVAIEADRLAPSRFAWRKYPDRVDIGAVRWALQDAAKVSKGRYLLGSEKKGWLVSEQGIAFLAERAPSTEQRAEGRQRHSLREQRQLQSERSRILSTEAFRKFEEVGAEAISGREAQAFFRIDDYVVGAARETKLTRLLNLFGEDSQLGPAVRTLAKKVREESTT